MYERVDRGFVRFADFGPPIATQATVKVNRNDLATHDAPPSSRFLSGN